MSIRSCLLLVSLILNSLVTIAASPSILHKSTNSYGSKWVSDQDGIRCLSFKEPSEGFF